MAQQPTYLLAPNFHWKPETCPIQLGSIISNPLQPQTILTTVDAATLQSSYPLVETFNSYDRTSTLATHRDVSMGVWTTFLQAVSGNIAGEGGSGVQSTYKIDHLETVYFVAHPDRKEIQARLDAPSVQEITKAGRMLALRAPVYMITGRMIAKGFTVNAEHDKHRNGEIRVSGSAPSPLAPVGFGGNLTNAASTKQGHNWRAGDDLVFAYQLLEIECKGWKGRKLEYHDFRSKDTLLGIHDEEESSKNVDEVEGFIIREVNASTLAREMKGRNMAVTEVGDAGNRITCIYSK
ncbi:hypothetical protein P170DRAFT_421996 [Aspergillus steynii IBT 23096]|uniref:Uncharacterized protein n=1 Tax=Aspergillus steynii IBT 23096 TaxID=1392250 RepID=A0A2I2GRD5_9EURO|nr:uncharacterized protein P170DRAFT_421996 [Aspergillus steynii IBT 23096]PLB55446.1 hypothetical protein P170DRAFT_421996 [Aspergillus steynii IBT 23096]